jgi:hypothetical protein
MTQVKPPNVRFLAKLGMTANGEIKPQDVRFPAKLGTTERRSQTRADGVSAANSAL